MPLKGKSYIVTGSSRGIGAAIVEMLLEQGAKVLGLSRTNGEIDHNNYLHYKVDFNQTKELEGKLKAFIKTIDDIDGIICSAGVGRFGGIEQFSFAQMQSMMNVNFLSQACLVRLVLPKLKQRDRSDIVFIGSEAALEGSKNGTMYCASKFAVRGFTQALREECGKSGVRVSLINPGMVKTSFFDELNFEPGDNEDNYIEPQDIAECIKLILSARSGTSFDEINLSPLKKVIKFNHGD